MAPGLTMKQVLLGACIGACCCVLLLAAFGAVTGLLYGAGANGQYPPGLYAALLNAAPLAMLLGPVAAVAEVLVGSGVGVGLWVGARRADPARPQKGGRERWRCGAQVPGA